MNLHIHPSWKFSLEKNESIDPRLIILLKHIQLDENLTNAADAAGISYRHAWNIINKWNERFSLPLVTHQRGRGSSLTALGKKLVWAEQLIEAQLTPQIENLTSLINAELSEVLGEAAQSLQIHASHGYAVALLPNFIRKKISKEVGIKFTGSIEAVRNLCRQECDIAGLHLAQHPDIRTRIANTYSPYLQIDKHVIIRMVIRRQGFIVPKGNPKKIQSFLDLKKENVVFINRQQAAGTRALFDEFLLLEKLSAEDIDGYTNEEFTHAAIAAHVASGTADVGLGIEYAATNFNLDFVPIIDEQYVLACHKSWIKSELGKQLIEILKSKSFEKGVNALPGYIIDMPGEVISIGKFFN